MGGGGLSGSVQREESTQFALYAGDEGAACSRSALYIRRSLIAQNIPPEGSEERRAGCGSGLVRAKTATSKCRGCLGCYQKPARPPSGSLALPQLL